MSSVFASEGAQSRDGDNQTWGGGCGQRDGWWKFTESLHHRMLSRSQEHVVKLTYFDFEVSSFTRVTDSWGISCSALPGECDYEFSSLWKKVPPGGALKCLSWNTNRLWRHTNCVWPVHDARDWLKGWYSAENEILVNPWTGSISNLEGKYRSCFVLPSLVLFEEKHW